MRSRQILSSVLLLVFCIVIFNYLFFIVFVKVQKADFRKELLNSSSLSVEKLQINKTDKIAEIEYDQNTDEVILNGRYFEILRVEKKDNNIVLYVIKDEKENKLFDSFFSSQSKSHDLLFNIVKLFLSLHISEAAVQSPNSSCSFFKNENPAYSKVWRDCMFSLKRIKPPQVS
ncbi:MAG: hypothetical protein JWO32_1912 [Bacteroidetes bacterium]|nr:hypothetical protein [Bacteroidota bacterium]